MAARAARLLLEPLSMAITRARSRSSPSVRRVRRSAPAKLRKRGAARAGLVAEWIPLETVYARAEKEWAALARTSLEPNVFLEPGFAIATARHLARRADRYSAHSRASGNPGHLASESVALGPRFRGDERNSDRGGSLGAVAVRAGERLLGLLPGRVEGLRSGRPVPTFVAWTHPFAPLSTPLVDREAPEQVVRAMLEALPALPGAPRVALLPFVAEDGPVGLAFAGQLNRMGRAVVRLSSFERAVLLPGGGAGAVPLPGKRLAELRRQRRRLAEAGKVERLTARNIKEIEPAVADFLSLEASGWKGRAGSAALLDPASMRFFREAMLALGADGKAEIDFLRLDGRAIAAAVTLYSGDRAWGWKTAYDESLARYSPGMQLALELTERLSADRRLSLVDSCAMPGGGIVDHLWFGRIAVADWLVPLDRGLSFQLALAAERARRAAIAAAKRLRNLVRSSD
jgi:CelD/BcsL family acetyltransferase involved in cellulose biosynthesis